MTSLARCCGHSHDTGTSAWRYGPFIDANMRGIHPVYLHAAKTVTVDLDACAMGMHTHRPGSPR